MMIRKLKILFILFAAFSLMFSSCNEKVEEEENIKNKIKKPEPFLEKEEYVEAMVDFEIAEAAIKRMASFGENTKRTAPYYYKHFFNKWDLTLEEYDAITEYYAQDPEEMEEIYAEAISRIEELKARVTK